MDNIWSILGLEPAQDVSAIRRAYAQQTKQCHPEEDPEGFMHLRETYQAALAWAEGDTAPEPRAECHSNQEEDSGRPKDESNNELGNAGWVFPNEDPEVGPNPFEDSEAIRQFIELYAGKQRKNPKLVDGLLHLRPVFGRSLGAAIYRASAG